MMKSTLELEAPQNILVLNMQHRASLRRYNYIAGTLHFVLCLFILITKFTVDVPFQFELFTNIESPNEALMNLSPVCNGTTYAATDAFKWLRCISVIQLNSTTTTTTTIQTQRIVSIGVWVLIFLFELITAGVHFAFIRYDQTYFYFLALKMNPFRFLEYSVTNTIMVLILCAINVVQEIYLVLSIFFLTIALNFFGGFLFTLLEYILQEVFLNKEVRKLLVLAKTGALVWSWCAFLLPLVLFWNTFTSSFNALLEQNDTTVELWTEFYRFISILNIVITIAYSIFPVIHLIEHQFYLNASRCNNYVVIEKMYIIASMFAKTSLVVIVFAASIQRSE